MEGISKIMMSGFFLLGLFLLVPTTAAQASTTCDAVNANISACNDAFVGVGIGQGVGAGATLPRGCCMGLQQIGAIQAKIGGPPTCRCLQRSAIFSNHLNVSVNAAILEGLEAGCGAKLGTNITIDLRCLHD